VNAQADIKILFELMREYRVSHFKHGDMDITIELAPLEPTDAGGDKLPAINVDDAKYWSAPEPVDPEDAKETSSAPTTT